MAMNREHYDYLVVGAGLTGAVFAREARRAGKSVLVIDKRDHIGGNVYTEAVGDIDVHRYGAHILHTSDKRIWDYLSQFAEMNRFVNSPVAIYTDDDGNDEIYNLPFNMNTFAQMWGASSPSDAERIIDEQRAASGVEGEPSNLEEQALSLVGRDIFEKLVKGYTEKQWGRDCRDLPADIIKRLPVRFTYDNNYFNDVYQGIPVGGYTTMISKMLWGNDVLLNTEYADFIEEHPGIADKTIYCGTIDGFFGYELGHLEYRSLRFETEELPDCDNYQGNAVINYTSHAQPYTRIIEHKWFQFGCDPFGEKIDGTVITREYPADWRPGDEPYYPVNDERNEALYREYEKKAESVPDVVFAGRLGRYRYYDMCPCVDAALDLAERELGVEIMRGGDADAGGGKHAARR